jgi:L,D-transpeptidase-like protein
MRRSHPAVGACAVAATVLAVLAVLLPSARGKTGNARYVTGSEIATPQRASLALRAAPGSTRVLAWVERETVFGSPTRLAIVGDDGDWLEVISDRLRNNAHGYVRRSEVSLSRRGYVLEADLSRRELVVWRWGEPTRRFPIAIGAHISPTPTGRFSITDKYRNYEPAFYGCCLLLLSGHQTHLPPGWTGGDRLGIHEGRGIGGAVSAGCLRASGTNARYLMQTIPLGTQVVIKP